MSTERQYSSDNRKLNDPPVSQAGSEASQASSTQSATYTTRFSVQDMPQPIEEEEKRPLHKKFVRWLKYGPID